MAGSGDGRRPPPHDECDEAEHEENEEYNLRDANGGSGESTEAQHGCDECDDEEGNGPGYHMVLIWFTHASRLRQGADVPVCISSRTA